MFIYTILEMLWLFIIWSESSRCLQMKTIFKNMIWLLRKINHRTDILNKFYTLYSDSAIDQEFFDIVFSYLVAYFI